MDSQHSPQPQHYATHSSHQRSSISNKNKNRKLFLQQNSQQQQQIVIPYWDEQNSSAHYHLIQQIRLLKKKNSHFQSHMSRMKLQYEQLRINLQQMDQNQRQHIRRHAELGQRYNVAIAKIQQLKMEIQLVKHQNNQLKGDLKVKQIREDENRKKINKLKDQQGALISRNLQLEQQLKWIKIRNQQQKRILQKSRKIQLQILKHNLQHQNQSETQNVNKAQPQLTSTFNDIITSLKACVQDRDNKISKLQKQYLNINEEYEKIKNEKNKQKIQVGQSQFQKQKQKNLQIQSLKNRYIKQIELITKQVNSLRIQNIKLKDQNNYYKTTQLKYQQKLKQHQKKQKSMKHKLFKHSNEYNISVAKQQNQQQSKKLIELENEISQLKKQINLLRENVKNKDLNIKQLINKIGQLQNSQEEKQNEIKQLLLINQENQKKMQAQSQQKLQKSQRKKQQLAIPQQIYPKLSQNNQDKSLSELQQQYNSELQALRRLILYKKYSQQPPAQSNHLNHKIREQYQQKFDILVLDYQQLQKQLLILQEQLILSRNQTSKQMITFRTSQEERVLYLQAIRKWQIAYQQLNAIYQAKLVSKDEQINLLSLKLLNKNG